ncbi:allophanate hydrolase [Acetobacter sp.]|jgi:allophanate hydrolase|uniref:allophanate hydrolase n=1 Tax=Acetobacter sp. TaxID=440 RepID=UPI0025BA4260|nr:allophanate hydrolase [Acetobacter sp.]MCH4091388.1 allophanate hydrolase [Acetobacter sp.]MCI1299366.1 allophanate hydrolase [Acetobacter sp.]MCI1316630.1 allophanate hydrolase [Acetobacter sp.]
MTLPNMLQIAPLLSACRAGTLTPTEIVREVSARIEAYAAKDSAVWISRVPTEQLLARAAELEKLSADDLPLYGIPFAVKDNIDVAGLPTTAACPAFAYEPSESAEVIKRLEAAGAIVIGKTNLDQFATGLVGMRSPYGQPHCVFNADYVSGGSSSGSAVAVAAGLVSFSLGTDTAGSGRVPAAFNNIVGLKPSRGVLSTRGLVPACESLDCISVFAGSTADAWEVERIAGAADARAPFSRTLSPHSLPLATFRFAVLSAEDRFFDGNEANAALYEQAIQRLEQLGGTPVELDFAPLKETAALLYSGPFVVERLAAIKDFYHSNRKDMDPTVGVILDGAVNYSATDVFDGIYRQHALQQVAQRMWNDFDVMLLPTAPRIVTKQEVIEQPIAANSLLGAYTNFVNLLDMAACAVPAGFAPDGLPFGVTFVGPAFTDEDLAALAGRFHEALGEAIGAARSEKPESFAERGGSSSGRVLLAVVGAHLKGFPLHWQLEQENAVLRETTRTAPDYRLFALPDATPPKPGLVRERGFTGEGLEVEVYELDTAGFGRFVASVPQPMSIGRLTLANGKEVCGFLCSEAVARSGTDITATGGWRCYMKK